MLEIKPVSDAQLAFPATIDEYLPPWDDIPEEYRDMNSTNKWRKLFSLVFYGDKRVKDVWMRPKEGVDPALAGRHLRCVMGSFDPKHQHKVAGVSYLMSEWFEDWGYEEEKDEEVHS